jgi:hypothetical protein
MLVNIDDVATGVLVDAVAATGRLLIVPVAAFRRRRSEKDVAILRWLDNYEPTGEGPGLPDLPPHLSERFSAVLRSDEVRAVLQELLAARLTGAPGAEVEKVHIIWEKTLSSSECDAGVIADKLFSYYDDKIQAMIRQLEGHDKALLQQIRDDAKSARLFSVLNAIERHTAVLSAPFESNGDKEFLINYRRQVIEQHGKIEPPDFERRRRVPIADIYVPTAIYRGVQFEQQNPGTSLPTSMGRGASSPQSATLEPADLEADVVALDEAVDLEDFDDLDLEDFDDLDLDLDLEDLDDEPSQEVAKLQLSLRQVSKEIDRTVLLGDPGAGKTTAANVLAHDLAGDASQPVPFIVTLRDFATLDPPRYSVVEHIEQTLKTFYQCPAPPGLLDRLLLTGQALVVFDGLDELLDTSRRRDVSTRVERFCTAYPLARVLVTSRLVGYDQARLDDKQFALYQLGGFSDEQVREYAHKWFTQEPDVRDARRWANSFLTESAGIPDLRVNPLLLSLLCILYRGEGSLPRKRSEVYEQCAKLLFDKWDARRRIHRDLRAGHLIEPTLQYLAWWLFSREQAQAVVTERELVLQASGFLHGRGFESEADAREAATEFVEFCRGRMWVFSDAGTTATGESLYAFTHRTFMEYFAAAYLAYNSDTPEQLARTLAPHIARRSWDVVAELSIQIKDRTSGNGARRIYAALLDGRRRSPAARANILDYLAICLRSVDPSPVIVRRLTRQALASFFASGDAPNGKPSTNLKSSWPQTLSRLLATGLPSREPVADEVSAFIDEMVRSGDPGSILAGLRFAAWLPLALPSGYRAKRNAELSFWVSRRERILSSHAAAITTAAETDGGMRQVSLEYGYITIAQALEMHGGLAALFRSYDAAPCPFSWPPYLQNTFRALLRGWPEFGAAAIVSDFHAIGSFLCNHSSPPWIRGMIGKWDPDTQTEGASQSATPAELSQMSYLGALAVLSILTERGEIGDAYDGQAQKLGPLSDFYPYLSHRRGIYSRHALPALPIPDGFNVIFREWAARRVDLVGIPAKRATG